MFAAAKAESDRYDTEQLAEEKIRVFAAAAADALRVAATQKKNRKKKRRRMELGHCQLSKMTG